MVTRVLRQPYIYFFIIIDEWSQVILASSLYISRKAIQASMLYLPTFATFVTCVNFFILSFIFYAFYNVWIYVTVSYAKLV